MLVMGARDDLVIGNIRCINICSPCIVDIVLNAVIARNSFVFDKFCGDQQLSGVADGADHLSGSMKIGDKLKDILILPHVFHRFGSAGKDQDLIIAHFQFRNILGRYDFYTNTS